MLQPDVEYRLAHHEDLTWTPQLDVYEHDEGLVLDEARVTVTAMATDHRPVEPTIGYRIEHEGRVVALGGDTVPCPGLDTLCSDADVYVQTVLRDDLVLAVPMQRFRDTVDYHSTVVQAAQTAARNRVRTLVLTHYVPTPGPGALDEWRTMAAEHFDGEIVAGDDLTHITV
jgi:ribonuclease Z